MKYFASVSYDGAKFYGFQKLNGHKTVQEELERALSIINKGDVFVKGAGRTDRGVHAYGQGISFELDVEVPIARLLKALNRCVDKSIKFNSIEVVSDDFHARFSAKSKIYEYVINLGDYNPIINDYVYNYNKKLDIRLMKKCSKELIGKHSFKAFTSGERDSYDSELYSIKFKLEGDFLTIRFKGKSFYRYMVRNLVGMLITKAIAMPSNTTFVCDISHEKNIQILSV